ncbi:hypothetical protein D3H35_13905 [Cohnella faecalis]|uniref:Uncharacterized protein n=1 Tax=Cohnella faecalis TaxID=2315694 RepID=A0A398CSE9_9BACL|nr:hypothetical protein D3H35_13905 [Cohnella faecalis]
MIHIKPLFKLLLILFPPYFGINMLLHDTKQIFKRQYKDIDLVINQRTMPNIVIGQAKTGVCKHANDRCQDI